MRTSNYNFDIDKHSLIKPVVIIRSGDHDIDTIKITLSNQGDPVDLTKATVTFMGTTPTGNKIIDDAHVKIVDATTGIFEYTFPSAAGASVGEYQDAYFSIILGNGQTSTMNFRIQVLSGVDISAPAASEYITHYDTMVTALNSAYDSATHETNEKMASTVSSLATSAATVLDSALARVNDINSTANNASSAASNAVSMAASVASTITSQASYINSVASSAASNVSSVAASVVDKLNNLSIGGRNYLLNSSGDTLSGWGNSDNMWSITSDQTRGNVFTGTPTIGWTGGGQNSITQSVNKKTVGQQVTVSFWAKASVNGAKFHSEPQGGANEFNPNLSTDWAKYSYTISSFSGTIYFMAVDAGTTYYIDDIKLEIGNIASDWTPAPEDVDNKLSTRNATFTDFNDVARNMVKYSGSWVIADQSIANSPLPNYYTAKITPGFSGGTDGYIELVPFASGSAKKYIAVVGSGTLSTWKSFAFDDDVVHKTGNETIAGDKTVTGKFTAAHIMETGAPQSATATTTFNGLTFSFTRVGSSVYVTTGTTAVTTAIQPGWYDGIIPAGYRTIASVEMAYFQKPSSGGFVSTSPSGRGYFNAALVVGDKPRIVAYYPTTDPWPAN